MHDWEENTHSLIFVPLSFTWKSLNSSLLLKVFSVSFLTVQICRSRQLFQLCKTQNFWNLSIPFYFCFQTYNSSYTCFVFVYNTLTNTVEATNTQSGICTPKGYRFCKKLIHFQLITVLPNVCPLHIDLHLSVLQCAFSWYLVTLKSMPHILIVVREVPFFKVPIFILIKDKPVDTTNKLQILNGPNTLEVHYSLL